MEVVNNPIQSLKIFPWPLFQTHLTYFAFEISPRVIFFAWSCERNYRKAFQIYSWNWAYWYVYIVSRFWKEPRNIKTSCMVRGKCETQRESDLFIMSVITDQIGRNKVLIPIKHLIIKISNSGKRRIVKLWKKGKIYIKTLTKAA